jgi:hypothetical protein
VSEEAKGQIQLPFAIGDVFWLPVGDPQQRRETCPICAGQLAIIVRLGSGEEVGVPCEACGLGHERARGFIDEWVIAPRADRFEIFRVTGMRDGQWRVESTDGAEVDFERLFPTEEKAIDAAKKRAAEVEEQNMRSRQHKREDVKRGGWSIQYHRQCIARLEKELEWHQAKVLEKKKAEGR